MFNIGDKVVPLNESNVYMVVSVPVGLPDNVIGRYSIESGTRTLPVRDSVRGEILRKARPIEEVRWNLVYLGYKITDSGKGWLEVDSKVVVEFDVDSEIPFSVADVNGYQLSVSCEVLGITRSAIYFLELK